MVYSNDIRKLAIMDVVLGHYTNDAYDTASKQYGPCPREIRSWVSEYRRTGIFSRRSKDIPSQPRTQVTSDHLELLKNELIRNPGKYGDEMASFLEDETGHIYSSKVLCKALDHAGWPKKAIQFHAKQQNITERYQF